MKNLVKFTLGIVFLMLAIFMLVIAKGINFISIIGYVFSFFSGYFFMDFIEDNYTKDKQSEGRLK